MGFKKLASLLLLLVVSVVLIYASFVFRNALLVDLRPYDFYIMLSICLCVFVFLLSVFVKDKKIDSLNFLLLVLLVFTSVLFLSKEIGFQYRKWYVLKNASSHKDLGSHFVVGIEDTKTVQILSESGGITGVYLKDNDRTVVDMLLQINSNRDNDLIVAADQEGGIVSRLSPPLEKMPPLSSLVGEEDFENLAYEYGSSQGEGLYEYGVNLNLSPVVDLESEIDVVGDSHSFISQRSISSDPNVVAQISESYIKGMMSKNVMATAKHFPGIGHIESDTHRRDALVPQDKYQRGLSVFEKVLSESKPVVMLSHAKVEGLEENYPTSVSNKMVRGVLREALGFKGVVITDDFSMHPISHNIGVGPASIMALNSGVDLILFSYDSDLYFEAMYYLMKNKTLIDSGVMNDSKIRITSLMSQTGNLSD